MSDFLPHLKIDRLAVRFKTTYTSHSRNVTFDTLGELFRFLVAKREIRNNIEEFRRNYAYLKLSGGKQRKYNFTLNPADISDELETLVKEQASSQLGYPHLPGPAQDLLNEAVQVIHVNPEDVGLNYIYEDANGNSGLAEAGSSELEGPEPSLDQGPSLTRPKHQAVRECSGQSLDFPHFPSFLGSRSPPPANHQVSHIASSSPPPPIDGECSSTVRSRVNDPDTTSSSTRATLSPAECCSNNSFESDDIFRSLSTGHSDRRDQSSFCQFNRTVHEHANQHEQPDDYECRNSDEPHSSNVSTNIHDLSFPKPADSFKSGLSEPDLSPPDLPEPDSCFLSQQKQKRPNDSSPSRQSIELFRKREKRKKREKREKRKKRDRRYEKGETEQRERKKRKREEERKKDKRGESGHERKRRKKESETGDGFEKPFSLPPIFPERKSLSPRQPSQLYKTEDKYQGKSLATDQRSRVPMHWDNELYAEDYKDGRDCLEDGPELVQGDGRQDHRGEQGDPWQNPSQSPKLPVQAELQQEGFANPDEPNRRSAHPLSVSVNEDILQTPLHYLEYETPGKSYRPSPEEMLMYF